MASNLGHELLLFFAELCEMLTCAEALPVRGLCRGACEAFGPRALAAIAFAGSGPPHRGVAPRPLTLGTLAMWMRTWEACAHVAEAKGLSAGVWARYRVVYHYWDASLIDAVGRKLVADGVTCLGVLALWGYAYINFLSVLSDGSFVLWKSVEGEVQLRRAQTLAELAPLWDLHEEGQLIEPDLSDYECDEERYLSAEELNEREFVDKVAGLLMRGRPLQPARAPEAAALPRAPEQSGAAASCYEEVVHWEPAAEIPPEEARAISQQLWAGHVQRLAELLPAQPERSDGAAAWDLASEGSAAQQAATELWDTVFLVGLSRVCDALRAALRTGRELEPVRAAAAASGHHWQHASGAAVFLYPEQYPRVLAALREEQLRPHQVLIVEAFLPLLYQEILRLPSRADVRPCSRRPHMLVQEDGSVVAAVEKTFIRAPASARRRPESVVQSLRDKREGENPRRRAP